MNTTPPRRSMLVALQAQPPPPEALAIIKEGTPKPQTPTSVVAVESVKVQPTSLPKNFEEIQRPARVRTEKEREGADVSRINVTLRLPANLPTALLKASSDRKLKKLHPFTQQDIMAEALTDWLKRNGYGA